MLNFRFFKILINFSKFPKGFQICRLDQAVLIPREQNNDALSSCLLSHAYAKTIPKHLYEIHRDVTQLSVPTQSLHLMPRHKT